MVEGRRIDIVKVATAQEVVELSWEAQQQLLDRVRRLDGGDDVVRRFRAAGTSQRVKLDRAGKLLLLKVVYAWLDEIGKSKLPQPNGVASTSPN